MKSLICTMATCLALTMMVLLSACTPPTDGSGGGNNGGQTDRRALSPEFSTRKAVAYSGFRGPDRTAANAPTEANILEDLNLLLSKGFGLLRLFSADADMQKVLKVIKDNNLDLKVQLGAWISGKDVNFHATNIANLDQAISMANDANYRNIILAVSVGNETMVSWSFVDGGVSPTDMAAYIRYVRSKITQPVTTDDNWAFFTGKHDDGSGSYDTKTILNEIDYISMHTYPLLDTVYTTFWDWHQTGIAAGPARATAMMDASIAWAKSNFNSIKTYLNSTGYNLPIVIGETGWKSTGGDVTMRAHPINQKMYYDRLAAWNAQAKTGATPTAIFYFEAFDEPWKGSDDNWGLFDVNRKAKNVIWTGGSYNAATDLALPGAPNDVAVYYLPAVPNGTITKNTYTLFSETINTTTDAVPTAVRWDAWDGNTAGYPTITSSGNGAGGSNQYIEITPIPKVWGWGLACTAIPADDLSNFAASGCLNFSIKTSYAGKLEIGFFTGNTTDKTGCDVYLAISPGQYGYQNDGTWHSVSIPVSAISPHATPGYGMPASASLKMSEVTSGFVIADRYANTLNTAGSTTKLQIDNIFWSK